MKVIVDDKIPFLKDVLEPFMDVVYCTGSKIDRALVADADALIVRTRTRCNAELLEGSKVKFIATATIGFDHIDTVYCESNKITWTNAPGCNSGSVKQYVTAALLYWAEIKGIDLTERVMGVVGVGNVGSKIVRMAESLGMRVLLNDPPREKKTGACGFISLNGICREADIISMHVPLNRHGEFATYHLADDGFLAKINPGTLLINTSRGEVADSQAILLNRGNRQPEDMIFDVWEHEPQIDQELLPHAFLATPHIAGYSADGKANGTSQCVRAMSKFFNLGIDKWEPNDVPGPEIPVIEGNASGKSFQKLATECVLHTYPVFRDDKDLRSDPLRFEKLRGEYPVRREFFAYHLRIENLNSEFKQRFRHLGFNV